MRKTDIHAHLLPALDDGAANAEVSLEMLNIYKEQGVTDVFATPHFFPMSMALEDFLENREKSYNFLLSQIKDDDSLPKIHLGAEVAYFYGIGKSPDLTALRLGDTDYILIEILPQSISDDMIKDLMNIKSTVGLTPIIAHIERLSDQSGYKKLLKALSDGAFLGQINASFVTKKSSHKLVKKLLGNGCVSFVASDAHAVKYRPPCLDEALQYIKSTFKETFYDNIIQKTGDFVFIKNDENDNNIS
ncbi:MAG: hypothetical protein MJ090_05770 [Clostridia bacterium]|nr:hypothetical protein [Clostridia bacterium]